MIVHAGLIARFDAGRWRGALIEGPSGAGKSDLALRALDLGFRLVSDDRTRLWLADGRLFGGCPTAIEGLIEARGLGVLRVPTRPFAEVGLLVVCQAADEPIERLPVPERRPLLGVGVPVVRLHALEASATAKIGWALSHIGAEL